MSATPIFDLEQDLPEPPRKPRRRWLTYLLLASVGAMVAWVTPDAPQEGLLFLLPALYAGVLIHELGHLIAGKLARLDVGGMCVGGFMLMRSGQRWLFRFDWKWFLNLGGFVVPLLATRDFPRSRFAWFVAGGPIASALLAALCGLAVLKFGEGQWGWLGTLLWVAIVFIPLSLAPFSVQGHKSDGLVLWQLFRDPAATRRGMTVMAIRAEEAKGVRPRDWSPDLMEDLLKLADTEPSYWYAQILAWYRCADQEDEVAGLPYLENALIAASRNGNRAVLGSCFRVAAAASASTRLNVEQARVWLDRARKTSGRPRAESTEGIEARIAMIEGRWEDALGHWARLRQVAGKHGDSGIIRYLKDRIEQGESECRAALNRAEGAAAAS